MTGSDEAAVKLLRAMVAAASPCGEEDAVAAVILDTMRTAGFEAYRDDVGNVVGAIGGGDRTIMFLGHMDTAPGAVPLREHGGRLYGRGAVDAKGPLAAGIVAVARAAERNRARLVVIGAVQEEGPSVGARHLAMGEAPDLLIVGEPSNWDAMTLGYKGSQRFEMRLTCPSAHTGSPEPTVPELAFTFWAQLTEWCASFVPDATREFDRLTPKLISMSSGSDGLFSAASLQVGLRLPPGVTLAAVREAVGDLAKLFVDSRGEGVVGAAFWRARTAPPDQNVTGRDALRRGVLQTLGFQQGDAFTYRRNVPGDDPRTHPARGDVADEGRGRMQYAPTASEIRIADCGDFGVAIDFAPGEPAVRVERRGPLVSAFLRAIRAEGGEPRFKVKTGTSDWNVVASCWPCPTVAYGPGDSSLDHTPNEHIDIDEYLRGIRVLARVLEEV